MNIGKRRGILFAFTAFVSSVCPVFSCAWAQEAADRPLEIGTVREAVLAMDPGASSASPREFALKLDADVTVQISLESDDFDPELHVWQIRAGERIPIADNDDSGDSLNARVRFTAKTGGDFVVQASTSRIMSDVTRDHTHFRLTVSKEDRPVPMPATIPLTFDKPVTYKFTGLNEIDDGFLQRYTFHANKGQRVVLVVTGGGAAGDADTGGTAPPTLELIPAAEGGKAPRIFSRRQSFSTARAMAVFSETGDYVLAVRQAGGRISSAYSIDAKLVAVGPLVRGRLTLGSPATGTFSYADQQTGGDSGETAGVLYQEWALPVQRGLRFRLEMCSPAGVDSLLQLVGGTIIGERLIARADDLGRDANTSCGTNRQNAALDLTASENGVLRILVSTLRDTGTYTLVATERKEPSATEPQGM